MIRNPYPGLRPFERHETDWFFGREEQREQLVDRLADVRFISVVGLSGSGKSSLVRAGLMPDLEQGLMINASNRWHTVDMRPGNQPLRHLAEALLSIKPEQSAEVLPFLIVALRRGPLSMVRYLRENPLPSNTNLLLLVDQFEELFRYHREGGRNETEAFVALLLSSIRQNEIPIYVVTTMRSEFIGRCALFYDLPEVMNRGQFLVPRLTRDQQHEAIVKPAELAGGSLEPRLVTTLLNAMDTAPDQLPLLQHCLMRMWNLSLGITPQTQYSTGQKPAATDDSSAEDTLAPINVPPETGKDKGVLPSGPVLTMDDYAAVGGLRRALSNHADEAYAELTPEQQAIAQRMFCCLSERDPQGHAIRRPTAIQEMAEAAGAEVAEVIEVIEVFRQGDRCFLTPGSKTSLAPDTPIDISHESLIEQWQRMHAWVEAETESAETYRRLEKTACLWKEGKAALWGTPDLDIALKWYQGMKHAEKWTHRYGKHFEIAMNFLDHSCQFQEKKRLQELETERKSFEEKKAREAAEEAQKLYMNLSEKDQNIVRRAFLGMVQLGEGSPDTRRIIRIPDIVLADDDSEHVCEVLQIFSQSPAHLVTFSTDEHDEKTIYITDESLIYHWGTLKEWLNESRDDLRFHRRLEEAAAYWDNQGRADGLLWRSPDLDLLWQYHQRAGHNMTALQHMFFQASLHQQQAEEAEKERQRLRELEAARQIAQAATARQHAEEQARVEAEHRAMEQARSAKRLRQFVMGIAVLLVVAVGFALFAWNQREQAAKANQEAKSLLFTTYAQQGLDDGNTDMAIAFALKAYEIFPSALAEKILAEAAYYTPGTQRRFVGHTDKVTSVAFRPPDGKMVLSGSADTRLCLWDAETGAQLYCFNGHTAAVNSVACSPDGRLAASGSSDNSVCLWDLAKREKVRCFTGHSGSVNSVAFSPDGKTVLSGSDDMTVRLWDIETGLELRNFQGHLDPVCSVAFSPDGRTAASGGEGGEPNGRRGTGELCVWDVASGNKIACTDMSTYYQVATYGVRLTFHPNGSQIIIGFGGGAGIGRWDIQNRRGTKLQQITEGLGVRVAVSPDGNLILSGRYDGDMLDLWDSSTGQKIRSLSGHTGDILSVAFSPDGTKALSGSADHTLRLWDISNDTTRLKLHTFLPSVSSRYTTWVAGAEGNQMCLWDVKTNQQIQCFAWLDNRHVVVSHDGTRVLSVFGANSPTYREQRLQLWDITTGLTTGQLLQQFTGHPGIWAVTALDFSPTGEMMLSGSYYDQRLCLWKPGQEEALHCFSDQVTAAVFSPDGKTILSGANDFIGRLWDIETRTLLKELKGHTNVIESVAFSPDGRTALTGSNDSTMRLWDLDTGEEIRRFEGYSTWVGKDELWVGSVAFSPDGTKVLSGSGDQSVRLWEIATGTELRKFIDPTGPAGAIFAPDGQTIISSAADGTRLWDVEPPQNLVEWIKQNRYVYELTSDDLRRYGLEW